MKLLRKKYVVVYIIKEHGTYSFLKKKKIRPTKNTVQYKKGMAYIIDITKPTYIRGFKLYYFVEIKKGLLDFEKKNNNTKSTKKAKGKPEEAEIKDLTQIYMSPEITDAIMNQDIVLQILNRMAGGIGINWMSLITGLAIGGIIGLIGGLFL